MMDFEETKPTASRRERENDFQLLFLVADRILSSQLIAVHEIWLTRTVYIFSLLMIEIAQEQHLQKDGKIFS